MTQQLPSRRMSDTAERSVPRWLPSPAVIFVLCLAGVLFGAVLGKGAWDSDYYWHVTTGQLIANGHFPTTDPFSFTWGGRPWTLHEWLSELLMYRLVASFGYMGAVGFFAVMPGVVFAILALGLAKLRLRTVAVVLAVTLSALVLIAYMTVRPQVLSWIFFAVLVVALMHLTPARKRWLLAAFPFFVLWANVHGLWAVGLGYLGLYMLLTFIGLTPMAPAKWWMLGGFLLAAAGTALTPAGPAGILYPLRYVEGGDWGLANITEWQSPDFHEPAHLPLLILIGTLLVVGRRNVPLWLSIFAWLGVVMALLALRNAPIAGIVAAPALAYGLHATLPQRRARRTSRSVAIGRRAMEAVVALAVVIASFALLVPRDPAAKVQERVEENLPVQGTALLKKLDPDARVAAEYGWGGYVIHELYPTGGRVMVDGRNDMYDQSILETYGKIREADPDWTAIADRYRIDALLFPPDKTITKGPARDAGWCEVYRDGNEVLYLRSCPS
jgi:hypothetical protein